MRADDDGFINKPKSIMRMIGCKDDDMKILIGKKFIIPFESGVVVIKHWKIHNYISKDRYTETKYKDEKSQLSLDENKAYTQADAALYTTCIQPVDEVSTQDRLGKDRIGKDSNKGRTKFVPPTVEEVKAYCLERKNGLDAQAFCDFYESKGWKVGKEPMKDWKAAVRTWENRRKGETPKKETSFDMDLINKRFELGNVK